MLDQQNRPEDTLMAELISAGLINLNVQNRQGLLPLHIAVRREKHLLVESLLQNGAQIDAKSQLGDTALAIAIDALLPEMVRILLEHKASLKSICKWGRSGLWLIVNKKIVTSSDQSKRIVIIDLIIQHGLKSEDQLEANYYKLCKAIINNNFRSAKRLIDTLEDINFNRIKAENPLKFAVHSDQLKMTELLLTKGVSYHRCQSALILAIKRRNVGMAKLLLKFKTNTNFRVIYLDKCKHTPLYRATGLRNIELMKLLIEYGANVNDLSYEGNVYRTALHLACKNSFFEGIKLLLENQADVNRRDNRGETPLHYACQNDHLDSIKLLVEHKAQITALDKKGFSILHFVRGRWNTDIVKYIINLAIENGININARDNEGYTPINNCTCDNFLEFLKYGADLNIQSKSGRYPAHACLDSDEDEDDEDSVYDCPSFDYLQRLSCLGYVTKHPSIPRLYYQIDWSKFYSQELNKLKNEIIAWNPRTTLYDVLFMSRETLVRYSKNINLTEAFVKCKNDFEIKYPYFGSFLNVQYRHGVCREKLMNSANDNLQKVFGKSMPNVCRNMIFKYLEDNNLKRFANYRFN